MYQVILENIDNKNYYFSYIESDDTSLGNASVEDLPPYCDINKARSCYYLKKAWIFDSSRYESIKNAEKEQETKQKIEVSDSEKLQLLADYIKVDAAPSENGIFLPEKIGYTWKKECVSINGELHIRWILVKDEEYVNPNDGSDYLKAINWVEGDSVTVGLWYNVGDDYIWQAIKSGYPTSATDKNYFDIP